MNRLSLYARVLELEAELQRIELGEKIDSGRRRWELSWLLPMLGAAASWFARSRGGWRVGIIWAASQLAARWRSRKRQLT